ncbi:unnamed protein product, partial [Symbiodinium sp. KB8]
MPDPARGEFRRRDLPSPAGDAASFRLSLLCDVATRQVEDPEFWGWGSANTICVDRSSKFEVVPMMPADDDDVFSPDDMEAYDLDKLAAARGQEGEGVEGMDVPAEREATDLGTGLEGFAKEDLSRGAEVERPLGGEELGDTESLDPENLNAESPSNNAEEFNVFLQKLPGMRLGMECVRLEGEVVVQNVAEGMVVGEWNSKNPDKIVKVGDIVRAVNQLSPTDTQSMLAELRNAVVLNLRFERGPRDLSKAKENNEDPPSLIKPSGGDLIRMAQRKLMEEQNQQRAHAMQDVTRSGATEALPRPTWQAASEWTLDGRVCEEVPFLSVYGYKATDKHNWDKGHPMPSIQMSVDEHVEQAGNTWYLVQCSLRFVPGGEDGTGPEEHLEWKAPRRLHHLRTDLHDRMKYFMEEDFYAKVFGETPFARHGGLPGTTARLRVWLERLAQAINQKEVPPEAAALVLLFFHAPLPSHVETPPASVD